MTRQELDDAGIIGHLASATNQLIQGFQRAEEVENRGSGAFLHAEKDAMRRNIVAAQEELARRLERLRDDGGAS